MSGRLLDRDERTRTLAVREFVRPLLVEAGAGTGKTSLLVARVLSWCLGPGWQRACQQAAQDMSEVAGQVARGVVAITFTEKAAAEMASRLGESFAAVVRGDQVPGLPPEVTFDSEVRQRGIAFLRVLDRFTICTIHAYCRRLLATYPLEAGLAPEFVVDAEDIFVSQAVEEAVGAFLRDPPADLRLAWERLSESQVSPNHLRELVQSLLACGAHSWDLNTRHLEQAALDLSKDLAEACSQLQVILQPVAGNSGRLRKLSELSQALSSLTKMAEPAQYLQQFRQFWRNLKPDNKLRDWSQGRLTESEREAVGELADPLAFAAERLRHLARAAEAYDESLFSALFPLAGYLLQQTRRFLEEQKAVTFHDLLVKAVALLQDHPEICQRERQRLQQLLVDEFQDTDRWQAALLRLLALSSEERPGLFVVGDPKQSIYGWRSADLGVYQDFAELVERAGGFRLELVRNFRSVPAVLQEVRRLVAPVMHAEAGVQPPFQELVPHRQGGGFVQKHHRSVEHWVIWGDQDLNEANAMSSQKVREKEAQVLAAHLWELHFQHGVPFKSVVVLFRALSDVHVYLEALRAWGIPTQTQRDRTYFQRREVLDALCLLRAVAQPQDQAALVGFLRSPWAGLPDAAWLPLARRGFFAKVETLESGGPETLKELEAMLHDVAAELPPSLPGRREISGWEASVLWALGVLRQARQSFRTDPLEIFLNKIRDWLQLEVTEAARFPGRVRLENLSRLFRLFSARAQALGDPQKALAALGLATQEVTEMPLPPPEAEDAVLLSSIHQVKGLDFDHVFLVDTHRRPRDGGGGEVRAAWLPQGGVFRLVLQLGRWTTPNAAKLQQWEERVSRAELVRLLYVATTRARDRLVVCGPWGREAKPGSLMHLLGKREDLPKLEELYRQLPPNSDRLEAGGALWVFPKPAAPPVLAKPRKMPTFPLEEAKRQGQRVIEKRRWAQCYQTLPLVAPASAEAHEKLALLFSDGSQVPEIKGAATLAGSLVHRVLQLWNWQEPPQEQLARFSERLACLVPPQEHPEVAESAVRLACELLERFAASPLFADFCDLGQERVARELPFILEGDGQGAVGAFSGSLDLVVFSTAGPVVVDFKTDRVLGEELEKRAEAYRPQGQKYCLALQKAWGLKDLPAFELWFLWSGVRHRLW